VSDLLGLSPVTEHVCLHIAHALAPCTLAAFSIRTAAILNPSRIHRSRELPMSCARYGNTSVFTHKAG
jgi:hypothetical protein